MLIIPSRPARPRWCADCLEVEVVQPDGGPCARSSAADRRPFGGRQGSPAASRVRRGSHCRWHVEWRVGSKCSGWGPRDSAPVPPSRSEARPRPPDGQFGAPCRHHLQHPPTACAPWGCPRRYAPKGSYPGPVRPGSSSPTAGPAPPPSSGLSVPPGEGAVAPTVALRCVVAWSLRMACVG
jgi:hypothetical protein